MNNPAHTTVARQPPPDRHDTEAPLSAAAPTPPGSCAPASRTPPTAPARIPTRAALCGLLLAAVAGCGQPPAAPAQPDPAAPVRAYFTALAAGDTTAAYQLSRSASRWLTGNALAHGYQPPTAMTITATTFVPGSNGNAAYIRATYQLGAQIHESTLEVWRTPPTTGEWAITAGATGRLDVISHTPHVTIANLRVPTLLSSPRIAGGIPSAGFYDVPPGIYTVTTQPPDACHTTHAAVPAAWRDGTPATADLTTHMSKPAAAPLPVTVHLSGDDAGQSANR